MRVKAGLTIRSVAAVMLFAVLVFAPHTQAAGTISVNSNGDVLANDGVCTLREAIISANTDAVSGAAVGECAAGSGTDTINFAITGTADFTNGGQNGYTISPTSALPDITEPVIINGYSQAGALANTAAAPLPLNGRLLIEIDGTNAGTANGLRFTTNSDGSAVRGMVINNFAAGDGIMLVANDVQVQGNYIGTNPAGTTARPNVVGVNSVIYTDPNRAQNVLLGGLDPEDRNLISGNTGGTTGTASYPGTGWVIQGNYIGVAADGLTPIANSTNGGSGAFSIDNCSDVIVGGSQPGAINVIGESLGHGIAPDAVTNLTIEGNYIGLGYDGTTVLGNITGGSTGSGMATSNVTNFTLKNNRFAGWKTGGISINGSNSNVTITDNLVFSNSAAGITVLGSSDIQIGTVGHGNTVRDNNGYGISLLGVIPFGIVTQNIRIQANTITSSSYNVAGAAGIFVQGDPTDILIGGVNAGAGNTIHTNSGPGVAIARLAATSVGFEGDPRVSILGNSIYDNAVGNGWFDGTGLGIDLLKFIDTSLTPDGVPDVIQDQGPTLNDTSDPDTGPNNYMNFPVINSASQTGTALSVNFDLDAADSTDGNYRVEFFANDSEDPSGYGEGQTYLGSTSVTPGSSKTANLTLANGTDLTGKVITATTTAVNNTTTSGFGATSEFSQAHSITVTPTSTTLANTGVNAWVYLVVMITLMSIGAYLSLGRAGS